MHGYPAKCVPLQAAKSAQDGELNLQCGLRQSAEASAASMLLELKAERDHRLAAEAKVKDFTHAELIRK